MWTKDGELVEPHTEGATRHVIGKARVEGHGISLWVEDALSLMDPPMDLLDTLIKYDHMSFSIDTEADDFPREAPIKFKPKQAFPLKKFVKPEISYDDEGPPQIIQNYVKARTEAEIRAWSNPPAPARHPAALPNCTCPWNNGFKVKGHHIACPYLKGHHDPEDDCGPDGHNNRETDGQGD